MDPLISIIVPVYQVEKYIANTMKSICNQTYKNIEVILVNDGTMDNSIEIAEKIIKNNLRYVVVHQVNQGQAAARNKGFIQAKGEWVVFIDADDYLKKNFIEILVLGATRNKKIDLSIVGYEMVNIENVTNEVVQGKESSEVSSSKVRELFLKRKLPIIITAILIRRSLLLEKEIKFDISVKFSEDLIYIWNLFFASENIVYNSTPLYNYLRRENSIMTSSDIKKIMTGYHGFVKFSKTIDNKKLADNILNRWIFGMLHSTSKIVSFHDYNRLLFMVKYNAYIKGMFEFPDFRVKLLVILLKLNRYIFYRINRLL